MFRVNTGLILRYLNILQKRRQVAVGKELLENAAEELTFIKYIITGDETWIYEYDVGTVQQTSEWRSKNVSKSKRKTKIC